MMRAATFIGLLCSATAFATASAADNPRPPLAPAAPPTETRLPDADFLLLGDRGTIQRIVIQVDVGGRTLEEIWESAFSQLFSFHDRKGDGKLNPQEATRLPAPFGVRQILWTPISQFRGRISNWRKIDLNHDGTISREEMVAYYRRHGVGGVTIGAGRCSATDRLTRSLLKHLDADDTGTVSDGEWKQAAKRLARLDVNADELIAPDEIVPKLAYPGAQGAHLWPARIPSRNDRHPVIRKMPLRLFPRSTVDMLQLSRFPATGNLEKARPATRALVPTVFRVGFKRAVAERVVVADTVRATIRSDAGSLPEQRKQAAARIHARFREADINRDGTLEAIEITRKKQSDLKALFDVADRDADGKVTRRELYRWLALQDALAEGQVLVSVLDFQRGLFELLDENGDGRLSLRELGRAATIVKTSRRAAGARFDPAELPWLVRLTVSRGRPQSALQPLEYTAPEWFRALDRNRDGDVSAGEFIGPKSAFEKLDRNHDGLISPEEAKPKKQAGGS